MIHRWNWNKQTFNIILHLFISNNSLLRNLQNQTKTQSILQPIHSFIFFLFSQPREKNQWVIVSFVCRKRIPKRLDQEARESLDHRGSLLPKKNCIFKHYPWHFNSINCLRGLKALCLGELVQLALEDAIYPILFNSTTTTTAANRFCSVLLFFLLFDF